MAYGYGAKIRYRHEPSSLVYYDKKNGNVELKNLTLPELIDLINAYKFDVDSVLYIVEKGEENKSVFHSAKNKAVAAKIGVNVGKNFAVTKIISDFLEFHKCDLEYYIPKTAKWNHKIAVAAFNLKQNRTNQEQRDALRCIAKYK